MTRPDTPSTERPAGSESVGLTPARWTVGVRRVGSCLSVYTEDSEMQSFHSYSVDWKYDRSCRRVIPGWWRRLRLTAERLSRPLTEREVRDAMAACQLWCDQENAAEARAKALLAKVTR